MHGINRHKSVALFATLIWHEGSSKSLPKLVVVVAKTVVWMHSKTMMQRGIALQENSAKSWCDAVCSSMLHRYLKLTVPETTWLTDCRVVA